MSLRNLALEILLLLLPSLSAGICPFAALCAALVYAFCFRRPSRNEVTMPLAMPSRSVSCITKKSVLHQIRRICEVRKGNLPLPVAKQRLLPPSQLPPEFLRLGCGARARFRESWRRIVQSARLGCRLDQESDGAKFRAVHDGVRGGNKRHGSCELARFPGHAQWGVRRSLHQLNQVHQSQLRSGITCDAVVFTC